MTDVGHLTSDADEGEDKIERAALKEGKNADGTPIYLSTQANNFDLFLGFIPTPVSENRIFIYLIFNLY